jgi:hypothetical protein
VDEGHDPDSRRQRTREEGLAGQRLPEGLRQEQRGREESQGARATAGGARGPERGEDEEGRGHSGAAAVDGQIGRQQVDGGGGEERAEPQDEEQVPALPAGFEPGAEAQQDGEIRQRHPRRPVDELPGQQAPDLAVRHADPVVLQGLDARGKERGRQADPAEPGRHPGEPHG